MDMERVEQMKKDLSGLGTENGVGYTQKEIIDRLIALENALLAGVYEKNHAENMRPQDLRKHFSALAEEFGLDKSESYRRFAANMDELERTVKGLIAGQKGERIAKSALRPLAFDGAARILYNVVLSDDALKTEYDAILIAPGGVFVIEVKIWFGEVLLNSSGVLTCKSGAVSNNLAARMVVKETLLREHLGELFPPRYHGVLLFPEEKAVCRDEYHHIPICYGAGVVNHIRSCGVASEVLSKEQIAAIAERIESRNEKALVCCSVRCDEIIEDYAFLMAQMEAAAGEEEREEIVLKASVEIPDGLIGRGKAAAANIRWKRVGKAAAGVAVVLASGFALGRAYMKK